MCLVLEVGKVYVNKRGNKIKIVSDEGSSKRPFIGVSLRSRQIGTYRCDGSFDDFDNHPEHLVKLAPTPHPHAELMKLYAEDAAECEKPWLRWELDEYGKWENPRFNLNWSLHIKYRRKPQSEWPPEAC